MAAAGPAALALPWVAFMTLTLFPIRLLFAAFMMLLAWPFALVASLGPADKEPEQPLALWRKVVDFLLKAIMRTMWFVGGFHRVAVKGRQALPTEAAILTLAPHSSYFDAIPVTMTMSSIVMKAESRDIPIWGKKGNFGNLASSETQTGDETMEVKLQAPVRCPGRQAGSGQT
ncbi:PREDICTED: lysophosphatidylcholine acyltransferase 1-like, partial [Galeopterus variegatus]|uniref:Lysophosphatidylcholine acyltransferase 1-like n=1 Tax=Galeopterus variegatus TaxID=482537 RepID=A0ABM0SJX1_GALVR